MNNDQAGKLISAVERLAIATEKCVELNAGHLEISRAIMARMEKREAAELATGELFDGLAETASKVNQDIDDTFSRLQALIDLKKAGE